MSLTLYVGVFLITNGLLQLASATSIFQSASKRTLLGASAGGLSYGILSQWTATVSVINASLDGDLGFQGYIFGSGFFVLAGVWAWNLYSTRKYLVR